MARALLQDDAPTTVGRYRLRSAQRETCRSLRQALDAHAGALLADAPGSGKTVIALAVAAGFPDVLVIAPAAVRAQWQRAATRAGVAIRIESHEALSRGRVPTAAALIIVDEAHHLRNPATQRYRSVAALARGRRLLLLTATPVVNRVADRDALLALFLGSVRANDASLHRVVVLRREPQTSQRTTMRRLPNLQHAADVPGLGAALAALPAPFPTADGASATALVRVSLAMAWASSLAALDAALRRREQRGRALADRLADGAWPSRHSLSAWLLGDDATQLALPLTAASDRAAPSEALAVLERHLAAVRHIRALIAVHVAQDTAIRADALRALLDAEAPRRVLLLAHHAETVRELQRALRHMPGVVAIIGQRVIAAAGRWTRDEVVAALGPKQPPWSASDPRGIRLLLATDILAEGVELQGCATVVHGDLAWTPARLEQRVGRVAREGQREAVHVARFALPLDVERILRIEQRLLHKRRARRAALTVSDAATQLQQLLATVPQPDATTSQHRVAFATADRCAFLALLQSAEGPPELVAGEHAMRRWRLSRSARRVARILRVALRATASHTAAADAFGPAHDRQALRTVHRLLRRWLEQRRSRMLVRGAAGVPDALVRSARRVLDAWVAAAPLATRSEASARASRLMSALASLRGRGAEHCVQRALSAGDRDAVVSALAALLDEHPAMGSAHESAALRLSAVLILRPAPPSPAPPSACSGTAAPR